jgi:exosome complex RNA-binding protein Rrp4
MKTNKFGQMLEELLHVKRLAKSDLAQKMGGINPSNITRYLNQENATTSLIERIGKALNVEIIKNNNEYVWIDLTNDSKSFDTNVAEENQPEYNTNAANIHIDRAKALVKKRLHDAIVEACMQTPEQHRPEVFKYFLQYQDSSEL